MEVSSPPGTIVGTIEQEWSIFCPSFAIKNPSGETVLRIEGPFCTMTICGDVEFQIMSADGKTQVGKISKQWSGLLREMFTDTDYFGISFPMDLDVRMKAVMIGACFLIVSVCINIWGALPDFMFCRMLCSSKSLEIKRETDQACYKFLCFRICTKNLYTLATNIFKLLPSCLYVITNIYISVFIFIQINMFIVLLTPINIKCSTFFVFFF